MPTLSGSVKQRINELKKYVCRCRLLVEQDTNCSVFMGNNTCIGVLQVIYEHVLANWDITNVHDALY